MKILVIGDTHGKLNRVRDIWNKLWDIDLIAHTGDYIHDAERLEIELGVPVIGVPGNCDGSHSSDDFEIIETEYGNLLLIHGHANQADYSLDSLRYKALENDCRAVLFGHTHRSLVLEEDDMYYVNPGSLTLPRDNSGGSYAIVRTAEDSFTASIVYYNTVMGSGKKSTDTGFVSGLLNYSDRF